MLEGRFEDRGVDLIVMIDELIVVVVVFFVVTAVPVGAGRGKVVGSCRGRWLNHRWPVGLCRPDVRELEVNVVEVCRRRRTSVRVARVARVDILVLAGYQIEVVETAR